MWIAEFAEETIKTSMSGSSSGFKDLSLIIYEQILYKSTHCQPIRRKFYSTQLQCQCQALSNREHSSDIEQKEIHS